MITFIEPNTPAWYQARVGCFTASEVVRLFKGGTRPMTEAELKARVKGDAKKTVPTLFGAGANTYINEKVSEIINKKAKHTAITKPMQRGISLEAEAIDLFTYITGIKMQPSGLFKLNAFVAGTPDGHSGVRKVKAIVEVKCLNPENHSEICELETVQQLREYDESFYAQCQMNMYVTGAKVAYFISYDNRPLGYDDNGELDESIYDEDKFIYCIKWFKVKRDEAFIKELEMRLNAASDLVIEKLEKRIRTAEKNLARFNRTQRKIAS
jgi:hypothetical protein